MLRTFFIAALAWAIVYAAPARCEENGVTVPDSKTVLQTLRPGHPRLMLTDDALQALRVRAEEDATLARYVQDVIAEADDARTRALLQHVLQGPRLLSVSRECLARVYALAFAWRWTGDEQYAASARDNLAAVCAFPDWNPAHFLDTAEMSHAVGLGYDWLHSWLNPEDRALIRDGLVRLGLDPGILAYSGRGMWWADSEFNWNNVCNSGLLIGALAIAETDPDYARQIVPKAVASLPKALAAYGPDGVWMEGPGYWHYATRYTAYGLCALDTALGTDFGLSKIEGLAVPGLGPVHPPGPPGLFLNFADSGERSRRGPMPCMFWLARKYGSAFVANAEHALLEDRPARPEHAVWYVPRTPDAGEPLALNRHLRSPVDLAVFRSAWDSPDAIFAGVKGGYNQVNHGHLDLGSFELDALGVRWARDLGADNYNLPGYWDKKPGGKRWDYYRMGSHSHNVPIIAGRHQNQDAVARFLRFEETPEEAFVVIDLTSAYTPDATAARRGFALLRDRRAILVQDEFELAAPCAAEWGMMTDADIEIGADGTATLTQDGRRLEARVLAPAGAAFEIVSAEQAPPERPNTGVKRLTVRVPDAAGAFRFAILLAPVWENGAAASPDPAPLSAW